MNTNSLEKFDLMVIIIIAITLGTILYFLPTIISRTRNHKHMWEIFILNFLLGWTILGWIGCLVWTFVDDDKNKESKENKYEDLERIQKLKEEGVLTEKEFKEEKEKILNNYK